ncbi:MAG TPA: sigma 54-interacting transcriptional regulator [Polyangia bacterium]|nr:sigma 54-interacting transcriptional regulator [Polyangia bacterium]
MEVKETLPRQSTGLSITSLRVEVVEGPEAGATQAADADTLTIGSAPGNDLVLSDPTVSRYHLELRRVAHGIALTDLDSTNGTFVDGIRVRQGVVPAGRILVLGATKVRIANADDVVVSVHPGDHLGGLRGQTPVMQRLMARIERASQSDKPVLVVGESGTGKELCARALHDLGPLARGPFETVDCGALAPSLVASELFGHERGAFTSADRQHVGAFERAHGGTLFLDEIGELPPDLQTTLLGVLERRRFRRVGGRVDIPCSVRVVAATNRDLRAEVNRGTFRLDLYYRLAVVVLSLPPLRERADDVPLLIEHFLRECGHVGPAETLFSPEALESMRRHTWPGNVRELRNVIESTVAMGEPPDFGETRPATAELPQAPGEPGGSELLDSVLDLTYKVARDRLLRRFEAKYLERLLARTKGNVSQAAREAQMDRSHLTELIARHNLK